VLGSSQLCRTLIDFVPTSSFEANLRRALVVCVECISMDLLSNSFALGSGLLSIAWLPLLQFCYFLPLLEGFNSPSSNLMFFLPQIQSKYQ